MDKQEYNMKHKIGILGGTFNPIHNAHLQLAKAAYNQYGLEKVLLMVSPNPPHKAGQNILDVKHRNNMVKLAIEEYDYLEFSDFEQQREGYIYTADTLTLLKKNYPMNDYYFIVGGDSLNNIDKWYHPEIVLSNCILLVGGRDELFDESLSGKIDEVSKKYDADIRIIDFEKINVSSTEVRAGDFADVPQAIVEYIKKYKLY